MPTYHAPDGRVITPALSMQGAVRGDFLLDRDMSPAQPRSVPRVSTTAGIWQRVELRKETEAHVNNKARSETVTAWQRV